MLNGNTKRIVVIKDIPSNIIEEAILILKNDPETNPEKEIKNKKDTALVKTKRKQNDHLVKEAESIINNYISELKVDNAPVEASKTGIGKFKGKILKSTIINAALIASIAIVILIAARLI